MNNLELVIILLPIVFMLHDFEEIIFIRPWVNNNEQYMYSKFPKIAERMVPHLKKISTSGFALGVAIMFLIVSGATIVSTITHFYEIWLAAFMAFSLHLLMHIGQWIAFKRYVPSIVTSIAALPYSIYGFNAILESEMFTVSEIVVWSAVGLATIALSLPAAHFIMVKSKL